MRGEEPTSMNYYGMKPLLDEADKRADRRSLVLLRSRERKAEMDGKEKSMNIGTSGET